MSWLPSFMFNTEQNTKPFKQIHFNVVNLSASLVGVRVFNEDPEEVLCESGGCSSCTDFGPDDSDFLNGFEPISIYRSLQVGHQYTYKCTSGCADSYVGTVVVESLGCTYYAYGYKMATAFLEDGENPSSYIISQKEDPLDSSYPDDCKEHEKIKVVVLDEEDKIVVTLVLTKDDDDDDQTKSLTSSEDNDENWDMSQATLETSFSELDDYSDSVSPSSSARSKSRRNANFLSRSPLRVPAGLEKRQPRRKSSNAKRRTRRSSGGRGLSSSSSSSLLLNENVRRSRRAALPNLISDSSERSQQQQERSESSIMNNSSSNNSEKATRRTAMASLSMDNDDSDKIQETATRTNANEMLYMGQLAF